MVWSLFLLHIIFFIGWSTQKDEGCPDGFRMSNGSLQCWKFFNDEKRSWYEARRKCEEEGLMIAQPSDAVATALRKDLLDTYGGGSQVWLGARGDVYNFVWERNGTELKNNNPLWFPHQPGTWVTQRHCLLLMVTNNDWSRHSEQPYTPHSCYTPFYTLCEANVTIDESVKDDPTSESANRQVIWYVAGAILVVMVLLLLRLGIFRLRKHQRNPIIEIPTVGFRENAAIINLGSTHSIDNNEGEEVTFHQSDSTSRSGSSNESDLLISLMAAIVEGNCISAESLIKKLPSADLGLSEHGTPLLVEAAQHGHLNMCKLLLQYGASPDATDCNGFHSIYVAAQGGHQEVIKLIIEYGGDPQQPRLGINYTAADHVRSKGQNDLAGWLEKQRKLIRREAKDVGSSGTYPNEAGLVVFLNYIQFWDPKHNRNGAEKDTTNILNTFNKLQYKIDYFENLTSTETSSVLEKLKKDNRLWYKDSFVLIIGSHGVDRKTFYSSDGGTHDINEIKLHFTDKSCPQMKNKPKLLIANFCRGTSKEHVESKESTDNTSYSMGMPELAKARREPLHIELPTHMAVICSASEGVVSLRSKKTGSAFIRYLCETLRESPEDELNVIINTVADKMKAERLHHPTDLYERPFRKYVFKFQDSS
ncbi:unnamed protein product [Meganyctiphanes norvegica]|uniref:Uncharacterized protein n=1 Tax=Meganyctiphanes norvegica TaxID=48144 RepID=A0AAV2PYW7_MEGNR